MEMIEIKNIQGQTVQALNPSAGNKHEEELMASDFIELTWNSDRGEELPVGCYVEYGGLRYTLLDPYRPQQKDELEYAYTPQFQGPTMAWKKIPFFFYTMNGGAVKNRETDWSLTGNASEFLSVVKDVLAHELGEAWTFAIDAGLPASASLTFAAVDLYSGLNSIAEAFETEWRADVPSRTLYLEKSEYGAPVELAVGKNVSAPNVTDARKEYYNRFYAFGSTRNITQEYKGAGVNNLVNKRLTLDPVKYPGGYKDIVGGLKPSEVYSKVLVFDDIFPSSELRIATVRPRLMYTLDEATGEKVQIGQTEEGAPIYDQYAVWFFSIPGFELNNTTYGKDNPEGMLLPGMALSVIFESGALNGREFELIYHDKDETLTGSDGTAFPVRKGDYEIKFVQDGTYIVPALTGMVPAEGDKVVLYNIRMPEEYKQSAYLRLEEALDKEIARQEEDANNYEVQSYPHIFVANNPNLGIGRAVTYRNGDRVLRSRVIKLVTQLDAPYCQSITIGNDKIKRNTQQIKEELTSANKDINLLAVFNEMTQSIQQSYLRTQKMMLEGFAAIKEIWTLKKDRNGAMYAYSKYNVVSQYDVTAYTTDKPALPSLFDGLPIDGTTIVWEVQPDGSKVLKVVGGGGSAVKVIDSLLSNDTKAALSANQGRVLDEKIKALKAGELAKLVDVQLSTLKDGQVLSYNAALKKWENKDGTAKATWANIEGKPALLTTENIDKWIAAEAKAHTHSNKSVLDAITQGTVSNWNDASAAKHSHSNKSVLDGISSTKVSHWDSAYTHIGDAVKHITAQERKDWNAAYSMAHRHENKAVLDGINSTLVNAWTTAYNQAHTHGNKSVLDGITQNAVDGWNAAVNSKHSHSNKAVLDGITQAKVSNWDNVVANWDKAFYFDGSGNLRVKLNLVGEKDVSAYGEGQSSSGGAITIVDNLTSTAKDAALSANQGRILKSLIDSKGGASSWNEITGKPSWIGATKPTYAWGEITSKPTTLKGFGITDAYTKEESNIRYKREWVAKVKAGTWSRIAKANVSFLAGSFFLTIYHTRNGVVVNNTFLVSYGHNYNGNILCLAPNNFTQIKLRLVSIDMNDVWVEVLEERSVIGTTYDYQICATKINGSITPVTTLQTNTSNTNVRCQCNTADGRIRYNYETLAFTSDLHILRHRDTRSVNQEPFNSNYSDGISYSIKSNGVDGSNDGGSYHGLMHLCHYGDSSGGAAHQLTFTDNGNIWHRHGLSSWSSWRKLLDSSNYTSYCAQKEHTHSYLPLAGGKLTGLTTMDSQGSSWLGGATEALPCFQVRAQNGSSYTPAMRYQNAQGDKMILGGFQRQSGLWAYNYNQSANTYNSALFYEFSESQWKVLSSLYVQGSGQYTGNLNVRGNSTTSGYHQADELYLNSANVKIQQENNNQMDFWVGSAYPLVLTATTVRPGANNTVDLGTADRRWNNIFAKGNIETTSIGLVNSVNNPHIRFSLGSTKLYVQVHNNYMYLGPDIPKGVRIDTNGNLLSVGEITAYSDIRLKRNIRPLRNRGAIAPIAYTKDGKESIGFSAQEVRRLYPELVTEDRTDNHYLSVNYAQYVAVLQAQIIELQQQIDELKKK